MITSDYNKYLGTRKSTKDTLEGLTNSRIIKPLFTTVGPFFNGMKIYLGFYYIIVHLISGTKGKIKYAEYKRLEDGKTNKRKDTSISARVRSLVSLFRNTNKIR